MSVPAVLISGSKLRPVQFWIFLIHGKFFFPIPSFCPIYPFILNWAYRHFYYIVEFKSSVHSTQEILQCPRDINDSKKYPHLKYSTSIDTFGVGQQISHLNLLKVLRQCYILDLIYRLLLNQHLKKLINLFLYSSV